MFAKSTQERFFHTNTPLKVFQYWEHEFDSYSTGDYIRHGHVNHPYFRDQRNIKNLFSEVFRYGEHEFEYFTVRDRVESGHVTHPHFRGQRNIRNLFFSKIHFCEVFRYGEHEFDCCSGLRYYFRALRKIEKES